MMRLAVFVAVIGLASLFDVYFDEDYAALNEIEAEANENSRESNTIYLINQTNTVVLKTSVQFATGKKLQLKSQDKFIQKYYQLRNYQVLKAEVQTQTAPLINTYHYLAFKNYFFSDPDDDPLKV